MSDYISRQAAISAICNACGKIDCDKMDKCEKLQLPPANCSEFPNSSDTISRQQAIEALDKRFDSIPMEQTSEILMLRKDLRNLPPAQPEQLGTNLAEVGTDCISRQAALDIFDDYNVAVENGQIEAYRRDRKRLCDLPPAQPEIIRCKDCKHWIPYDWMFSEVWQSKNIVDYPEDEMGCDCCDMAMKANDFCSRGERRIDG